MARHLFNRNAISKVDKAIDQAITSVVKLAAKGTKQAVVVRAPAGAGKSWLICSATEAARKKHLRVVVSAPTNEQAFGLIRTLGARLPKETITFLPAARIRDAIPQEVLRAGRVRVEEAKKAGRAQIIVGTLDKLGDAYTRGSLAPRDILLMDEAYQADAARYFAAGHLAPTHLLVGDSGQLSPFSTIDDPERWHGLPEDPLQTAVGVLLRNHNDDTKVVDLQLSRRLDPRAVPIARSFYQFPFEAAVAKGVRQLRLSQVAGKKKLDRPLDRAAEDGWAYLELPAAPVLTADPATVELIKNLVVRLFDRKPTVCCERVTKPAELLPGRVAVGVSHNDQKNLLRQALDSAGLTGVVVNTANKLQGLEFDVVITWHPLAGLAEVDSFHLEPGRLCVLLTRHRHACIVIGRAGDRELVAGVPPATPAYLGWDPDPVLDGWDAHGSVFRELEKYCLPFSA